MNGEPMPLQLNIALHVGTLSAVLIYFWRDWLALTRGVINLITRGEKSDATSRLLPALIVGSIPAGIIGLLWQDHIEAVFHKPEMTLIPLAVFGIFIWLGDKYFNNTRDLKTMTWRDALLIGCAQALALIPGVSRSGSTILGGRALHFNKNDAARFSFLLGTPVMLGATAKNAGDILASIALPEFYVGMLVSMVVGCLSIKFLLSFIKKYGFGLFAAYRILLAICIFGLLRFT